MRHPMHCTMIQPPVLLVRRMLTFWTGQVDQFWEDDGNLQPNVGHKATWASGKSSSILYTFAISFQYCLYLPAVTIMLKIPLLCLSGHLDKIRGGWERNKRHKKRALEEAWKSLSRTTFLSYWRWSCSAARGDTESRDTSRAIWYVQYTQDEIYVIHVHIHKSNLQTWLHLPGQTRDDTSPKKGGIASLFALWSEFGARTKPLWAQVV